MEKKKNRGQTATYKRTEITVCEWYMDGAERHSARCPAAPTLWGRPDRSCFRPPRSIASTMHWSALAVLTTVGRGEGGRGRGEGEEGEGGGGRGRPPERRQRSSSRSGAPAASREQDDCRAAAGLQLGRRGLQLDSGCEQGEKCLAPSQEQPTPLTRGGGGPVHD